MINPDTPAPLPPSVIPQTVFLGDGRTAEVVTIMDAARLTGMRPGTIDTWITKGSPYTKNPDGSPYKVAICTTPQHERRVFVESLWRALPLELRR